MTGPAAQEFDVYLNAFRESGFAGPLCWYKTRLINSRDEQEAALPTFPAEIAALHVVALHDAALPPQMARSPAVLKRFPGGNLEIKEVDGDHWLLQVCNDSS